MQHEVQFTEVTPAKPICTHSVAVSVRLSGVEADICNGADAATVENGTADLEVMLTDFTGADRVYIACGYTDLRGGGLKADGGHFAMQ